MKPRTHLFAATIAVAFGSASHAANPYFDYWIYNTNGRVATSDDAVTAAAIDHIAADVIKIRVDAGAVYITSNSVPSHAIGPWSNPNTPDDIDQTFRIPMYQSSYASGAQHAAVQTGVVGILINGVSIYGPWADPNMYPGLPAGWHVDAMSARGEAATMDEAMGHADAFSRYHHHCAPMGLREQLHDHGDCHSPLLGFALDGFPIYGPYGYSDPMDPNSGIERMCSSYKLKSTRTGGPPTNNWPLGSFAEDYEYRYAISAPITGIPSYQLDRYNGRTCKTPEFPLGTYCYFITVDENDAPVYPYILGPEFKGVPVCTIVTPPAGLTEIVPTHDFPCAEICCQPGGSTASRTRSITLSTDVRYGENPRYYWYASGVGFLADGTRSWKTVVSGSRTATLTLSNVQGYDDRQYRCLIMDECGGLYTSYAQADVLVGDFDLSGTITAADISAYLAAYVAGSLTADVDDGTGSGKPNGSVTAADLNYFVARAGAGS